MADLSKTKPFGVHLDATLKVIKQDLIRRFKAHDIDLTPEQWTILSELSKEDEVYQADLAEHTFKDAPTVSRIVELLNKRGYVRRKPDEDDRRRFLITLTADGRTVYNKAMPLVYEARKKGWEGLDEKDHEHLNRILSRISSNILNGG